MEEWKAYIEQSWDLFIDKYIEKFGNNFWTELYTYAYTYMENDDADGGICFELRSDAIAKLYNGLEEEFGKGYRNREEYAIDRTLKDRIEAFLTRELETDNTSVEINELLDGLDGLKKLSK